MSDKINYIWEKYNTELDKVDVSNPREAINTGYLRRTISGEGNTAVNEIKVLAKNWKLDDLRIIEIGAGYGAYCEEFHKMFKVKDYTIIDTKSMLRFSEAYLKDKDIECTFVDTEECLPDRNWDLLIANICISEIPEEHAREMLAYLFKRVKKVAIMDVNIPWLEELIKANFDKFLKNECSECNQTNHYLYLGEKI